MIRATSAAFIGLALIRYHVSTVCLKCLIINHNFSDELLRFENKCWLGEKFEFKIDTLTRITI